MIRRLLVVAGCGFAVSLSSFAIAFALGPVDLPRWGWDGPGGDGFSFSAGDGPGGDDHSVSVSRGDGRRPDRDYGPLSLGGGPTAARELTWTGGGELSVAVPAAIAYTQGPVSRISVTGPKSVLDRLVLDQGRLRFDHRGWTPGVVRIVMTAPDVRVFNLEGSQRLRIEGYDQDRLTVKVSGSGDVAARGRARSVRIDIDGAGDIDLAGVAAEDGRVRIAGSGKAVLSPKASADVRIDGSGDVVLTTRPARLEQRIAGSGRIVQGAAPEA